MLFAVCLLPAPAAAAQRWLVVSDIHLNPYDASPQPAGYGKDTNWALFRVMLRRMKQTAPDPPVVVLAGDFLAHHFRSLAHRYAPRSTVAASALGAMTRIERAFRSTYPGARFVTVLGNNDAPCGDYEPEPGTPYLAALGRLWHEPATFGRGGYYAQRIPGAPLRIIALDSVFWSFRYRNACGTPGEDPGAAEFAWLSRALAATPRGTQNLVVMHVPPGIDPMSTHFARDFFVVPFLRAAANATLSRALEGAPVAGIIAGHLHRADFAIDAGVPVLIVSSISPVYDNNPSFTVLTVDARGISDAVLYGYDLPSENWEPPFDFDRGYGARRVDAAGLLAAHRAIAANPAVRLAWAHAFVSSADKRDITAADWQTFWCAQTAASPGEYEPCAGVRARVMAVPLLLAAAGVALVALVTLITIRLARQRRPR